MLAVIGAVGQAEREAMLERQREGIAKAKAEGRYRAVCLPHGGRLRDHPAQGGEIRPPEMAHPAGGGTLLFDLGD